MTSPDDRPPEPRANQPATRTAGAFAKRRAVALFVAAGIAVVVASTSWWWLPALPALFGVVEAKKDLIEALAGLTTIATSVILLVGAVLGYLGFRSLQSANTGEGAQQAVDVASGGRGAAIGGDVNRGGAVVVGDNNRVEFLGDVTYDYGDVAPSPVDVGTLEKARRQLESLPLGEVPSRAALPTGSVMPLRLNHHFVGREEQLKRIAANLKAGNATTISEVTVAASTGLGGVGKTQLASEFVHRYGRYFHGVYWVSFAEPDGVPAEIASCGGTRGMSLRPDFHTLPLEERVRAVMAAWQGELPRLLVFDNCEHEDLLDRWLPPTGGCRVLVTSRRGHWDAALGVIDLPLDVLDRRESVALLRKYRPDLPADSSDLDAIAEELGDLPLALDLAGRYLVKHRHEVTPGAYLADIRRPELLEHSSLRRAKGISPTKHDMDVWRTFALSYWRLDPDDETDGTAVRLLARAARLAPDEPIPRELLALSLYPPNGNANPSGPATRTQDALDRLTGFGLLDEGQGQTFRMHRLVAAFALAEIADDGARAAVETTCARAALSAYDEGQPVRQEVLLPHIRLVTDSANAREDYLAANCCAALGISLYQLRSYDEALHYAERTWNISVDLYGPEERLTLQRRNNIAVLHKEKRDLDLALTIYREVLEAQERNLGSDDLDVAATINNVGSLLKQKDLYHEMLPLYRRALDIREGIWSETGQEEPNRVRNAYKMAESRNNMGALLMNLGRHCEARPYLEGVVRLHDDELGEWHQRHARTLANLGLALRAQGDYSLSVSHVKRAVKIYTKVSGARHSATAGALANLGSVLKEQAEVDATLSGSEREQTRAEAENFLGEALKICESTYSEEHPMTGGILGALAGVLDARGPNEDAPRYRERAEAIRHGQFHKGNPDTASVLNAAGTSLKELGLYDEAHAYLEHALRMREDTLGEQDFDTSTSFLKLGVLLQLQGRNAQARAYLERALTVRVDVCGEDYPATELVRDNLRLLGG